MAIERTISLEQIEYILRKRALFRRLVYLSKRMRMGGVEYNSRRVVV